MQITVFKSIFDTKTDKIFTFSNWKKFKHILMSGAEVYGIKPKRGEPITSDCVPLMSPAMYDEGSSRCNDNVKGWSNWCAIDVDDYEGEFAITYEKLKSLNKGFFLYSTASSTEEKPKFRVVFPLRYEVPKNKIKHFWYALNKFTFEYGDGQTKDLSRMYYMPAKYPRAYNFYRDFDCPSCIDPYELIEKYDWVDPSPKKSLFENLPDKIRDAVISYRETKMTNTQVVWSSYMDCPYVSKKAVQEYMGISETGWYAAMYNLMVSIAFNAIRDKYPISEHEIATLCKEIDIDNGNWYSNRPMDMEAKRAIDYAYSNSIL